MMPPLVSKVTDVRISRGQKVRLETPGGGGFGDPATREPERVVRDVRLRYVSRAGPRPGLRGARRPRLQGRAARGRLARRRGHREGARADMSGRGAIVGVDVGGTFTDLFLLDPAARRLLTANVPS